ncbi:hypothetical protein BC941DRAFT_458148 [Chlamydoabsidia padenii]|nr:hypothetical protein BC941DRAFT_458148 [Chlamydoabsidia padenii]
MVNIISTIFEHSKKYVRVQGYSSVDEFIQGYKDMDDIDSSPDSDSDTGSHHSDSSDSSSYSNSSNSSTNTVKKNKSRSRAVTSQENADVASLTDSIKKMTVALMAQQEKIDALMAKPSTPTNTNYKNQWCYNCKEKGHRSAECDKPCHYCQQNHPHFTCSQHVQKPKSMDAKLCQFNTPVTQDAMTITRKAKEMEIDYIAPITKKKQKVNLKVKSTPKHLTEFPVSAQQLINQPVYQVSVAQLADLNTTLRTSLKDGLTRVYEMDKN